MRRVSGLLTAPVARLIALSVVLGVASAMVGGCASTGSTGLSKDSPEAVKQAAVAKRAEARWQAIIRRDFPAAYAYYTPASREVIRESDFVAQVSRFPYRAIKVDKVECEAEACTVSLTLIYDFPSRMTNIPTMLQESWLIERGEACLVYRA